MIFDTGLWAKRNVPGHCTDGLKVPIGVFFLQNARGHNVVGVFDAARFLLIDLKIPLLAIL